MPHALLTPPLACTGCGHRVSPEAAFCRYCGRRLAGPGRRLALDPAPWPPPLVLLAESAGGAADDRAADEPEAETWSWLETVTLVMLCVACFPAGAVVGWMMARGQGRRALGALMLALSLLLPVVFARTLWQVASPDTRLHWLHALSWRRLDPNDFLQVDDVRLETTTAGDVRVRGVVTNVGARPVRSATLMLTLRDPQGEELWLCLIPIAGDEVEGFALAPRGQASFTYRLPSPIEWQGDYAYRFRDFRLLW
jgi:hypothetical protein